MKINVYVASCGAAARRICWYEGTSDAQVEKSIRIQLHLPQDMQFLLNDEDGDIVPVSSTLPNGQHFTLVIQEVEMDTPVNMSPSEVTSPLITLRPVTSSPPTSKRRRHESTAEVINTVENRSPADLVSSVVDHPSTLPPRIAAVISLFVNTFTQSIANDDNVNFIPNTGRFALYALYMAMVRDTKLHPTREDVFYKMTSMFGKVDRQRVNRYYRCQSHRSERKEFVLCKPQGKGVLLRRYRKVDNVEELEDAVKSTELALWLQMDPTDVVALYVRFVEGFIPLTKSEYRAQRSEEKTRTAVSGIVQSEVQRE